LGEEPADLEALDHLNDAVEKRQKKPPKPLTPGRSDWPEPKPWPEGLMAGADQLDSKTMPKRCER